MYPKKIHKRPFNELNNVGFLAETALELLIMTHPTNSSPNQQWPVLLFPQPVFRHRRRLWMGVRPDAYTITSAWATAGHLPCQDSQSGDVVASLPPPGLATARV